MKLRSNGDISNFTLGHDKSFWVRLEVEVVDNRQQLDLIVETVVNWAFELLEALPVVYTDLVLDINYFESPVDASLLP